MGLLKRFIRNDLADLHHNDVRVRVIGQRDNLQPDIRALLQEAEDLTRGNTGLTLVVAFNYGGRQEIAAAMRRLAFQVASGELEPHAIDLRSDRDLSRHRGSPRSRPHHPDLGRAAPVQFPSLASRLREFVFLPEHWPDFDQDAFERALAVYHGRERRFGGSNSPDQPLRKAKSAL